MYEKKEKHNTMDIIELTEDNLEKYRDALSPDIAESIGRDFYRGIIARDSSGDIGGAMVWECRDIEDDRDVSAEIYYVKGSDEDTIKAMIESYDRMSDSDEVKKTILELYDISPEPFLKDGFDVREAESRDLFVSVGDLEPICAPKRRVPDYISSIGSISGIQFWQGITNCLYSGRKGLLEDIESLPVDWYDSELSCCSVYDDRVNGMLLVHRLPSGILMPVLFAAVGPDYKNDLLFMTIHAARQAFSLYPKDTPVLLRRHSAAVKDLTGRLFPGKSGGMVKMGTRG